MERSYKFAGIIFLTLMIAVATTNITQAYSIYPNATSSAPTTSGTSNNFNFGNSWAQLTTPFASFWNNLQTINPSDFSSFNPSNTSTSMQIPQSMQGNFQSIIIAVLTFFSWIFGWLKAASDWLVSLVHA